MKKRVRPTSQFVQSKKRYVYNLGRRRRPQDRKKNYHLGRKGKNEGDYNSLDRISLLPDELLVSILSLLPLKEATSTSILSRRWRYVWASTMNLVFDSGFNANPCLRLHTFSPKQRKKQARSYVDWVNSVMDQHEGTTIIRFRACFALDNIFTSSIDEWIEFAMNKRVEILELDFFSTWPEMECYYTFPEKLLGLGQVYTSKLEHPHPENPSRYSIGFESLKVFSLCRVSVTQEMLEYLISNCPVLERLTVGYATNNLVDLRVVGPRVALKYLAIESCLELKSIEIRDVNLVSFYYRGVAINLAVSKVPSLVDISMSVCPVFRAYGPYLTLPLTLPFDTLSCCLSQLEILELETNEAVYCENLYFQNRTFPTLTSLRQLKLEFVPRHYRSLCWLASSMKACPYLERLVLKQSPLWQSVRWRNVGTGEELDIPDKCPSQNNYLKVVEIIGYRHHPCVTQYVKFLIENMVALEKIIVDPVFHHWSWDRATFRYVFPIEEAQAREHAMQHLKELVPLTVEFVCL